jgi:uncharacterized membrane protein
LYFNHLIKRQTLYNCFIKIGFVFIVDTKKDATTKSMETKEKVQALQKWIKANQDKYDFKIIGGIVIFQHPSWILNSNEVYSYEKFTEWNTLFK